MGSPDHIRGNRQNHFKRHQENFHDPYDGDPKRRINTRRFLGYEHGGKRHRDVEEQKRLRLTLDLPLETDTSE